MIIIHVTVSEGALIRAHIVRILPQDIVHQQLLVALQGLGILIREQIQGAHHNVVEITAAQTLGIHILEA